MPVSTAGDREEIRAEPAAVLRAAPFAALGLADHASFRRAFDGFTDAIARHGASRALDEFLEQRHPDVAARP